MDKLAKFFQARLDEDEHFLTTMLTMGTRQGENLTPTDAADIMSFAMTMISTSGDEVTDLVKTWEDSEVLPPNAINRLIQQVKNDRILLAKYEDTLRLAAMLRIDPGEMIADLAFAVKCRVLQYDKHPDFHVDWALGG